MYLRYSGFIVYGLTAAVWGYGFLVHSPGLRVDELWFALLLAIVPASMVFGSMWVLLNAAWWRPLLGVVLLWLIS